MKETPYSAELSNKIEFLKSKKKSCQLGRVSFSSKYLLAPMSGITNAPFRLLMQELGSGGAITELISSHGINYQGKKTLDMLALDEDELNTGIQLFGENEKALSEAAEFAEKFKPDFIDINMGCPVRKVCKKGAGSSLMAEPKKLGPLFKSIKSKINLPLTIKIRTGIDEKHRNADQVIKIAASEGIEFVSLHGRTKDQMYSGRADWDYIEKIAIDSPLPIIGNGDLNSKEIIREREGITKTSALMIGRAILKNPFLFLEALDSENQITFTTSDYLEVINRLDNLIRNFTDNEKVHLIQMKKHIAWFITGLPSSAKFRETIYKLQTYNEIYKNTQNFFQQSSVTH